ncbi:unnamed protein product [Closterium sp. Naga37s-1]|nr:unnamed protein product [Closterium sp. Naga37s-1]
MVGDPIDISDPTCCILTSSSILPPFSPSFRSPPVPPLLARPCPHCSQVVVMVVMVGDPIDISDLLLAYGHQQHQYQHRHHQQQHHHHFDHLPDSQHAQPDQHTIAHTTSTPTDQHTPHPPSSLSPHPSPSPALLDAICSRIGAQLQRLHATLLAHESHLLEGGVALEGALPGGESLGVEGRVRDREMAALMGGAVAGVVGGAVAGVVGGAVAGVVGGAVAGVVGGMNDGMNELQQLHWQPHATDSRVSHWPFPLAAHPLSCLEDHRWPSLTPASHMARDPPPGGSSTGATRRGAGSLLRSQWAEAAAAAAMAAAAREAVVRQQEAERVALLFGFAARCAVGGGQGRDREASLM